MITSRFNKDEAALQRDYMTSRLKTRRLVAFAVEFVVMVLLYPVLVIAATPYKTDPLFVPLYPSALAFFIFGAVFLGTGMYFKKRFWQLADPGDRKPMAKGFTRLGMVWMVIFAIVLVIFLPMSPLVTGTNYAESIMAKTGPADVGPSTHIRLEFQGADTFGTVRAQVTVKSTNKVTLDFYLMYKSDADKLDAELSQLMDFAIKNATNVTTFEHNSLDLDASQYTVVIVNQNNETAKIEFTVFDHTSDNLSLLFVVFFLVYLAMVGGWLGFVSMLGKKAEAPMALPPAPVPTPMPPQQAERPTVQRGPAASAAAAADSAYAAQSAADEGEAAPEGGTRMAITCPRCATTFDVIRGGGPTRIKCPSCGKEGTLAGLPMPPRAPAEETPAPAPAPAAPAAAYMPRVERMAPRAPPAPAYEERPPEEPSYPAAAEPPSLPPEEPAAPAYAPSPPAYAEAPTLPYEPVTPVTPPPKRNIACPRCKRTFAIDKVEGPQHIKCPHCGKEGTIGGKKAPGPAPAPVAPSIPEAPVTSMPPPQRAAPAQPRPAPARPAAIPRTPAPAPAAQPPAPVKMISCPQCKKPFPVAETRRPLQVKCPNCGKEGLLRK